MKRATKKSRNLGKGYDSATRLRVSQLKLIIYRSCLKRKGVVHCEQ